jgi:hypothetical protein
MHYYFPYTEQTVTVQVPIVHIDTYGATTVTYEPLELVYCFVTLPTYGHCAGTEPDDDVPR